MTKLTDEEQVKQYMDACTHPLKVGVEQLREAIKSNPTIHERIKWNAPSYYTTADLVTFNLHNQKAIRLVFHHPEIVNITSPILEGNYPDRRLVVLNSMEEVNTHLTEIQRVVSELITKAK